MLQIVSDVSAIAIRESASVGDQSLRRIGKGVDDLDFYIGDEAVGATNYAVKVNIYPHERYNEISCC